MSFQISSIRRLWQPRHPLFWLILCLQLLSAGMAMASHLLTLPGLLRTALTLLALINTLGSWWLLIRLWRETSSLAENERVRGSSEQSGQSLKG